MLILAGPNNEFISYGLIGGLSSQNSNITGNPTNNSVTITTSFNRSDIDNFYAWAEEQKINFAETKVKVYALCNYTQDMLQSIQGISNFVGDAYTPSTDWVNFTQSVIEYSAESGIPNTGVSVLSTAGGLFMSNGIVAERNFPATADIWDSFSNEKNPFDLSGNSDIKSEAGETIGQIKNSGSILVERGMARFDFADGSATQNNTYPVGDKDDKNAKQLLNVQLVRMCLVNMSNNFYYFRHVAPNLANTDGQLAKANIDSGEIELCEPELPWYKNGAQVWTGNWVLDADYAWKINFVGKNTGEPADGGFKKYFNFTLGNNDYVPEGGDASTTTPGWGITPEARDGWYTSKISEVLGGPEDNDDRWNSDNSYPYEYHIWRYVTENTIPAVAAQKNGISTGIVFKALIQPGKHLDKDSDLYKALTNSYTDDSGNAAHPNLYLFDDVLYVSWANVEAEAKAQKAGSPLYNAVFGNTTMDANGELGELAKGCPAALYQDWNKEVSEDNDGYKAFRKAIVANGFAIYQHSGSDEVDNDDIEDADSDGGYFCYYYYWNRHNNNGRNGVMGPMEFQVVRNNVYKLAVTEITKLGHPRRTTNDPDPEDPGKDDEESKLYFKVQVEVLPWTVRVNNITF